MECISPFLEKCEDFCLLIEMYGHQATVSQTGEKVLGDCFSFTAPFVDGAAGRSRRSWWESRRMELTIDQVLSGQRSC